LYEQKLNHLSPKEHQNWIYGLHTNWPKQKPKKNHNDSKKKQLQEMNVKVKLKKENSKEDSQLCKFPCDKSLLKKSTYFVVN
jgi:hypothetical protein